MSEPGRNGDGRLARAKERGEQRVRELLRAHPTLSTIEAASRLKIAPSEVERLGRERRLLVVADQAEPRYPAFQLEEDRLLPGFVEVLQALDDIDGWTAFNFFVTADLRLGGRTPLEALRGGDVEAARSAASAYGEHAPA